MASLLLLGHSQFVFRQATLVSTFFSFDCGCSFFVFFQLGCVRLLPRISPARTVFFAVLNRGQRGRILSFFFERRPVPSLTVSLVGNFTLVDAAKERRDASPVLPSAAVAEYSGESFLRPTAGHLVLS